MTAAPALTRAAALTRLRAAWPAGAKWIAAGSLIAIAILTPATIVQRQKVVITERQLASVTAERDQATAALHDTVAPKAPTRDVPTLVRAAARYRVAQAKAAAVAPMAARRVGTRNTAITKELNDALPVRLAAARADAARASDRMCPNATGDRRPAGGTRDLPSPADAPEAAHRAGQTPVMDVRADLDACAAAIVKAEGWREWWQRVSLPTQ